MSLVGSASSIPNERRLDTAEPQTPSPRGGEAEPTRFTTPITDPELRAEVMKANRAWAKVHAPWLLEEWLND